MAHRNNPLHVCLPPSVIKNLLPEKSLKADISNLRLQGQRTARYFIDKNRQIMSYII